MLLCNNSIVSLLEPGNFIAYVILLNLLSNIKSHIKSLYQKLPGLQCLLLIILAPDLYLLVIMVSETGLVIVRAA